MDLCSALEPDYPPDPQEIHGAEPLVSVVVPAFNAQATLGETLRSIAAQDYRRLEILIVDDGSTDATAAIAAQFCDLEPRAKLLRKANGGVASARNHAIARARGDYVAPIDADDLWHAAKISRQVAAALAAPEPPGFVYCWFRDIEESGRVWRDGPALSVEGRALQRLACLNFVGNGSALLISRTALLEVGGYDESLRRLGAEGCEDLLVQLELARRQPDALVPAYLVGYRLTPSSMSSDADRMGRSWRKALEALDLEDRLSPRTLRWNEGSRALLLAETRALRGKAGGAFGSLGRAFRLDPVRTGFHLLLRTVRHLGRLFASERAARRFEEHAPEEPSPVTDRWLLALARFDQRRLDRVERLDR